MTSHTKNNFLEDNEDTIKVFEEEEKFSELILS